MTTTTTSTTPIVLPAWLQHFIVPILMFVAAIGAGLPTVFAQIDTAHGNALVITGVLASYGGILAASILTFWATPTWLKLALQVLGVLVTIVAPFLAKGSFSWAVDGPVLAVAVANGLLTAFGQYVRTSTSTLLDARESNVVTSLPTTASLHPDLVSAILAGPTATETPEVQGTPADQQAAASTAPTSAS